MKKFFIPLSCLLVLFAIQSQALPGNSNLNSIEESENNKAQSELESLVFDWFQKVNEQEVEAQYQLPSPYFTGTKTSLKETSLKY